MRTRPLDAKEFQDLVRAFGSHKTRHPLWDFIRAATFISAPLVLLFVSVSIVVKNKTLIDALQRGLPIWLIGPLFLLIQRLANRRNRVSNPFAREHEDMRSGVCQIRALEICRAWRLIDQGNEDNPDYLVETNTGKYIALSAHSIRQPLPLPLRRQLEIHELPTSKTTVAIMFFGDELPLDLPPIITDCVWRNDDLPWGAPHCVETTSRSRAKGCVVPHYVA